MKFVSTLLLLFGYIAHCLGVPCTGDDMCADVPARVCDRANCQPVTQEQLITIGYHFIRPLTCNKAPKPFVGFCPNKYVFNITKADYNSNMLKIDVTIIITYGARQCILQNLYLDPPATIAIEDAIAVSHSGMNLDMMLPNKMLHWATRKSIINLAFSEIDDIKK